MGNPTGVRKMKKNNPNKSSEKTEKGKPLDELIDPDIDLPEEEDLRAMSHERYSPDDINLEDSKDKK